MGVGIGASFHISAKRLNETLKLTYGNLHVGISTYFNIIANRIAMVINNSIRMHFVLCYRIKLIISMQCIVMIALCFSFKFTYMYTHSTKNHLREKIVTCKMCDCNSGWLYEDAFNISYNWKKWLPADVYRYHELVCKEVNAPVELQMGIFLPFISSVCGPLTKGHFLMRPSCLNLFWLNIAASGVGKLQTRKQMISEPLQYILQGFWSI